MLTRRAVFYRAVTLARAEIGFYRSFGSAAVAGFGNARDWRVALPRVMTRQKVAQHSVLQR